MFQALVDLVPLQDLVDLAIERVTRRFGNLLSAEKQRLLLRFALAHRHTTYDGWNILEVTCLGEVLRLYHRLSGI
jgi:hypothetical protein